jgi:hypothetical protein
MINIRGNQIAGPVYIEAYIRGFKWTAIVESLSLYNTTMNICGIWSEAERK